MNALTRNSLLGKERSRREATDVPERRVEDSRLHDLIALQRLRVERSERERSEARESWRAARNELRRARLRWRSAAQEAKAEWEQARAGFFKMVTTSGQFRKARAIYERKKAHAEQLHLQSCETAASCRERGRLFFQACRRVLDANRHQEKFHMLRDEMHSNEPSDGM